MRYLVAKDKSLRKRFLSSERKRFVLKAISLNCFLPWDVRVFATIKLARMRFSSSVRMRNRCISTGRARSVSRAVRLTRMKFRQLASFGLLYGIKKSSW